MDLNTDPKARRGIIWALWSGVEELRVVQAFDQRAHHPAIFSAAIVKALIDLNSAAQLAKIDGYRLDQTQRVFPVPKEQDLGALLAYCSAAVRHMNSPNNRHNDKIVIFYVLGPFDSVRTETEVIVNDSDDTAIYWGQTPLYLRDNLFAALNKLKEWYPTSA